MEPLDDLRSESELPSCTGCRKRKLKCSRQKPSCATCERLHIPCTYETRRNKPGLKSGAVESLNQRLEKVERALFGNTHSGEQEDHHAFETELAPPRAPAFPYETAFGSLAAELRQLNRNLSTTLRPQPQNEDILDVRPRKRRKRDDLPTHDGANFTQGSRPHERLDVIPETAANGVIESILEELLDAYFTHVQPWIPMIRDPGFRMKVRREEERRRLTLILQAMAVAALRYVKQDGEYLSAQYVEIETARLRRTVLLAALDDLSIENLQALIIIAFTDIGDGNLDRAWPVIASLSRTVEYMGLSVEEEERHLQFSILTPPKPQHASIEWVEEEERRRVFWNIFILDRFSSVVMGWNTSLTAADVCRRLPICGGKWYTNEPAVTPYLGIWDQSRASMAAMLRMSPNHRPGLSRISNGETSSSRSARGSSRVADMLTVGAFAHFVEAIESLSQITTYFLHPNVDFSNRQEVSNWLTRFKELDLRLVHWRMFLPQQWKDSGVSREAMPGVMDPNMTVANATHNISMILLHQRIAYPGPELSGIQLPSLCSAETCYTAAVETANIINKYLKTTPFFPVSPQLGICAFVSAKTLLMHSEYYKSDLAAEFRSFEDSLEEMSRRWDTNRSKGLNFFSQLCLQLRSMHASSGGNTFLHDVPPNSLGHTFEGEPPPIMALAREHAQDRADHRTVYTQDIPQSAVYQTGSLGFAEQSQHSSNHLVDERNTVGNWHPINNRVPQDQASEDELISISQVLMNKDFLEMDRIFRFGDLPSMDDLPGDLL
ncbi:hypothetical protein BJY04DRAFT_217075 [Aspergillus karnatakaensis]|uniref:Zn(II)2Cys6 transcription factor n=1 Tax=Aspergillus karnatakaensis TaxID=1810916 RepID=UPI003CCDF9A5